ncbi:3-hydroxyacyl-CoA dehydrogenase family protein [Microbispora sp. H13382]|uniref:3-hydroxyacyl-CoA dehydrogenase family protein n=1 Tax=Microbispora sp. H13382 TaxID=2729112 RepID=UPI0016024068|nr:3-hydroxyacyl-CoA dehydrogenase family protein [Microbispora sp. H13382]
MPSLPFSPRTPLTRHTLSGSAALWVNGVATPETVDAAWRIAPMPPFGPFQTLDVIGLKTAYHVAAGTPDPNVQAFAAALKEQYIDKGKLGTTTGEGFYTY